MNIPKRRRHEVPAMAKQLADDQQFYNCMQRYRHTSIAQQSAVQVAYLDVCKYVVTLFGPPTKAS